MALYGKDKVVSELRSEYGYTKVEADKAYDAIMSIAKKAADNGDGFRLPDMGIVNRNEIEAHEATNPQNGEKVQVPARFNYKMKSPTKDKD